MEIWTATNATHLTTLLNLMYLNMGIPFRVGMWHCGQSLETESHCCCSLLSAVASWLVKADHSALSSTPIKDSVSESSADDSEDEVEPPHKCSPFVPCSKAECKLRVAREREKDALENPCKNCDTKIYKYECCSEESGLCPDCCDELGACLA